MIPALSDNEGQPFKQITFAGSEVTRFTASEGGAVPQQVRAPSYHKLDSYESERLGLVSPFHSSEVSHAR